MEEKGKGKYGIAKKDNERYKKIRKKCPRIGRAFVEPLIKLR